ncbi:exopolysaccharide biosynthesis polyprenyl glycosylphosphotransferase [Oceanotoga sp. DSM 15011]|uniref:exopolysaccharide biosynthesis polyprenyl glycosylphosphotransferase n=1 Tax=Oceanotoga sp. DSM 15011 TaxID=2984951 RepID=UPI0021F46D3F|nr:exopolysaccharide biosynthesis polyprenyl glycosylphosphotransferase [Oceanotoga sp. DSM 15011]UYO99171.1 exopolysaccharide biosynthesis polyprenyl glycosylphosphotransferase [Oceanotoga sp. DSM 15011]
MKRIVKFIDSIFVFGFNIAMGLNIVESVIVSFLVFIGIYTFRVYDIENMESMNETFIRVFAGNVISFVGITISAIVFDYNLAKIYLFNLLFSLVLIPFLHKIEYYLYRKHAPVNKYLVIGREKEIGEVLSQISESTKGKMKFVEYINPSPQRFTMLMDDHYSLSLEDERTFNKILVTDPKLEKEIKFEIDNYKLQGVPVEYLPHIAEKTLKKIPLDVLCKFENYYKVEFEKQIENSPSKRMLDIITSVFLLIIFSPFMGLIYLGVLLEDGFPVVFKQRRIGERGKPFTLMKFRSLKHVPINKDNPNEGLEERVLKIGKFSRKTRLDESLQFINVLKGDMSIVGSRPEMPEFHYKMVDNIPYYMYRLNYKPGITGWAQINYKHTTTLEDYKIKTEYDLYYVKNRNLLLDIQIMMKTVETMLGMRGAR